MQRNGGKKKRKENIREITGCFFVLDLLFREESCEGDDVGVDFLASVCHLGGWCLVVVTMM